MIISPEAEADLADARTFYDRRQPGLGERFLRSVGQTLERIDRSPEAPRVVHRDVRRVLTPRFPFAVYYRLEGRAVVILAVIQSRRDPETRKSRA